MYQFQKYWQTWQAKSDHDKNWIEFQAHLIRAQADLRKLQQTSRRGGYISIDGANNAI